MAKGFGLLPCIKCGNDCCVRLDLDDCDRFNCTSCDEEYTRDEVSMTLAKWRAVLEWIDTLPDVK